MARLNTEELPSGDAPRRRRSPVEMEPTGRRLGTSPLYAFRECFKPAYGLTPTASSVYGVLSLIVWSLILIVSVKYLVLIMRLDNRGEGGIMALLALILSSRRRPIFVALGLFGAALLYGDGIITPAISVLSATEGLEVATPAFRPDVIPSTLLLLFLLFSFQRYGTARVGSVFGPIMLLRFTTGADDAMAEAALFVHVTERQFRHGLLRHPAGPRRRARRADRVLISRKAPPARY